jgi:hypothetical protein
MWERSGFGPSTKLSFEESIATAARSSSLGQPRFWRVVHGCAFYLTGRSQPRFPDKATYAASTGGSFSDFYNFFIPRL